VVDPMPTPTSPKGAFEGLAIGDGAIFTISFKFDGSPLLLTRFDTATQTEAFTVPIAGSSQTPGIFSVDLAYGNGALWFSHTNYPLLELDPRTGAVLASIDLPRDAARDTPTTTTFSRSSLSSGVPSHPVAFAFNHSGTWVVGGDAQTKLLHIAPGSTKATVVTDFGPGLGTSVAADDTYVWTTHWSGDPERLHLVRIDATNPTVAVDVGVPTPQVVVASGQVWFAGYITGGNDQLAGPFHPVVGRIDPETMKVIGVADVPILDPLDTPQLLVHDGIAFVWNAPTQLVSHVASH
jgi:hypothetical protein